MSVRLFLLLFIILTTALGCQQDGNVGSNSFTGNLLGKKSGNASFHYSDDSGRMTDPTGFTFLDGVFYTNYQIGNKYVSMNSKDNILWEKETIEKIYPENISSFVEATGEGLPTIEQIYVNKQGQVFTTMSDQPILEKDFLQAVTGTKLFYDANFKKWILIFSLPNEVLFYNSTDFEDWKHVGNFGIKAGNHGNAPWHSPDLFQMSVNGNDQRKKWVLMVSADDGHPTKMGGTQYFVGDFDGKLFVNKNLYSKVLWLDWGADNCGGLTTLNTTTNEQTMIGWMNGGKYNDTDNLTKEKAILTVPRKLELKDTFYGLKLFATPTIAFEKSRGTKISQKSIRLTDEENAVTTSFSTPSEFVLEFSQKSNEGYMIEFLNGKGEVVSFSYNGIRKMYLLNRLKAGQGVFKQMTKQPGHFAPRFSTLPKINVRIIVDTNSIEVFTDDGLIVFSDLIAPTTPLNQMKIWGTTGQIMMDKMEIYQLK